MKATTQIDKDMIEKVPLSITVTMPIMQWRTLMGQLSPAYPSWQVNNLISQSINQVFDALNVIVEGTEETTI